MMIGETAQSPRGFSAVAFKDSYDAECSLQCSSAIDFDIEGGLDNPGTSYLWVGIDDPNPQVMCTQAKDAGVEPEKDYGWQPYPIPEQVLVTTRMHLNREQVAGLIERLQQWLDNGTFEEKE